jgi:hypothetical protein
MCDPISPAHPQPRDITPEFVRKVEQELSRRLARRVDLVLGDGIAAVRTDSALPTGTSTVIMNVGPLLRLRRPVEWAAGFDQCLVRPGGDAQFGDLPAPGGVAPGVGVAQRRACAFGQQVSPTGRSLPYLGYRRGFLLGGEPPAMRVAGGGSGDLQVPQPIRARAGWHPPMRATGVKRAWSLNPVTCVVSTG